MIAAPDALTGDIERLIENINPATLLLVADGEPDLSVPDGCRVRHATVEQALRERSSAEQYDLGVFVDDNESLSKQHKAPLISGLRDIYTRRFVLAVPPATDDNRHWSHSELIAFGLSELQRYDDWRLFEYNILNYKRTPDWLNPKNWANPEMWGKFRW